MITLKNGDKWILSEQEFGCYSSEHNDLLPMPAEVPVREFIEKLLTEEENNTPFKITFKDNYKIWDSSVYTEVFGDIAISKLENIFSKVYEMPWGEILVVYRDADSGGYDVCEKVARFDSVQDYTKAVLLWLL